MNPTLAVLPIPTTFTSSTNQTTPIIAPDPIISYLHSKQERVIFLNNLAVVALGSGGTNPILSSIPQIDLTTQDSSISEYAGEASSLDPFQDSLFSTSGGIRNILSQPVEEDFRGAGTSHPMPHQQEMHNAAGTREHTNQHNSLA